MAEKPTMIGRERERPGRDLLERCAACRLASTMATSYPLRRATAASTSMPMPGIVLLALAHPIHPPIPEDVRRLDEDHRLRAHPSSVYRMHSR